MERKHGQMMSRILDAMNRQTDRQTERQTDSSILSYFILFKIGHLEIKNYKFVERVENFKYLGVILNEDKNNQIDSQKRIKKC